MTKHFCHHCSKLFESAIIASTCELLCPQCESTKNPITNQEDNMTTLKCKPINITEFNICTDLMHALVAKYPSLEYEPIHMTPEVVVYIEGIRAGIDITSDRPNQSALLQHVDRLIIYIVKYGTDLIITPDSD